MKRFYMFKDGTQKGSTETREEAIEMIRLWQSRETHPLLRSEFCLGYIGKLHILTPTNGPGLKIYIGGTSIWEKPASLSPKCRGCSV